MTSTRVAAHCKAQSKFLVRPGKPQVGKPGIAEIKPHSYEGWGGGFKQVLGRPERNRNIERWVLTYLPCYEGGKKDPTHIRVFAHQVAPKQQGPFELPRQPIPAMVPFPSWKKQPQLFGVFIEPCVRDAFRPYLPSDPVTDTGGLRWGVDMRWELASFYAELASETADPFFEELAAELSALASEALSKTERNLVDKQLKAGKLLTTDLKTLLRREARWKWEQATGKKPPAGWEVHHIMPLEFAHLFPNMDPNDPNNLVLIKSLDHQFLHTMMNRWIREQREKAKSKGKDPDKAIRPGQLEMMRKNFLELWKRRYKTIK
jgi:hypothetical protein